MVAVEVSYEKTEGVLRKFNGLEICREAIHCNVFLRQA